MVKLKKVGSIVGEHVAKQMSPDWQEYLNDTAWQEEIRRRFGTKWKMITEAYSEKPSGTPLDQQTYAVRYSFIFPTRQVLQVLVGSDGRVLERSYSDKGDIHFDDVLEVIGGWPKAIGQVQRGGRPKGMSKATQARYDKIWAAWQSDRSLSEKEFCRRAKITRRTLDRVIDYQRKKK